MFLTLTGIFIHFHYMVYSFQQSSFCPICCILPNALHLVDNRSNFCEYINQGAADKFFQPRVLWLIVKGGLYTRAAYNKNKMWSVILVKH